MAEPSRQTEGPVQQETGAGSNVEAFVDQEIERRYPLDLQKMALITEVKTTGNGIPGREWGKLSPPGISLKGKTAAEVKAREFTMALSRPSQLEEVDGVMVFPQGPLEELVKAEEEIIRAVASQIKAEKSSERSEQLEAIRKRRGQLESQLEARKQGKETAEENLRNKNNELTAKEQKLRELVMERQRKDVFRHLAMLPLASVKPGGFLKRFSMEVHEVDEMAKFLKADLGDIFGQEPYLEGMDLVDPDGLPLKEMILVLMGRGGEVDQDATDSDQLGLIAAAEEVAEEATKQRDGDTVLKEAMQTVFPDIEEKNVGKALNFLHKNSQIRELIKVNAVLIKEYGAEAKQELLDGEAAEIGEVAGEVTSLARMVANLKQELSQIMDSLQETKAALEQVQEAENDIGSLEDEYERISAEVRQVVHERFEDLVDQLQEDGKYTQSALREALTEVFGIESELAEKLFSWMLDRLDGPAVPILMEALAQNGVRSLEEVEFMDIPVDKFEEIQPGDFVLFASSTAVKKYEVSNEGEAAYRVEDNFLVITNQGGDRYVQDGGRDITNNRVYLTNNRQVWHVARPKTF